MCKKRERHKGYQEIELRQLGEESETRHRRERRGQEGEGRMTISK